MALEPVVSAPSSPSRCNAPASETRDSDSIATRVLDLCRAADSRSKITHVSKASDGSFRIRICTSNESVGRSMTTLRLYWPLAHVAVVQDHVRDLALAEVFFPPKDQQRRIAYHNAECTTGSRLLRGATFFAAGLFVTCFALMLFVQAH